MKKILAFLLVFALLACFSACGGKKPADETEPTYDPDINTYEEPEEESTRPGALQIDNELSDYYLDYYVAGKEHEGLPVLLGCGMEDAAADAPVIDIVIDVRGRTAEESFLFVLRSVVDENYANGAHSLPEVWIYGKLENTFVISLAGYTGGIEA